MRTSIFPARRRKLAGRAWRRRRRRSEGSLKTLVSWREVLELLQLWRDVGRHPLDFRENIVRRLDLLDLIRLSVLCKYWSSIAMRRDIRSTAPPFPWLVLAQRSSDYLEFSIPSEGKVIKIDLPKRNQGRFHSSSKGWLNMVKGKSIFLLNPISGDKQELPSLRNIPSLHRMYGGKPAQFLHEIALSGSNTSECTVAAIFSSKEIGVCRPGEKSWSIFSMLDDRKGSPLQLLFSSCGMLYVLVKKQ
nr:uncharacterized protein LOC103442177 [Malus domestica]